MQLLGGLTVPCIQQIRHRLATRGFARIAKQLLVLLTKVVVESLPTSLGIVGQEFDAVYGEAAAHFAAAGLLIDTPERIAFTDEGFAVSNAVLSEMLFLE